MTIKQNYQHSLKFIYYYFYKYTVILKGNLRQYQTKETKIIITLSGMDYN